eukprot:13650183-Alexandrium_andersonii.AAC.1
MLGGSPRAPMFPAPQMRPPPGPPPSGDTRPPAGPADLQASTASSRSPSEVVQPGAVPHTGAATGADEPAAGQPPSGPPTAPRANALHLATLRARLRER